MWFLFTDLVNLFPVAISILWSRVQVRAQHQTCYHAHIMLREHAKDPHSPVGVLWESSSSYAGKSVRIRRRFSGLTSHLDMCILTGSCPAKTC